MIIIKISIIYFIQIRHTDDFPSTGARLVQLILSGKCSHHFNTKCVCPACLFSNSYVQACARTCTCMLCVHVLVSMHVGVFDTTICMFV